ncbi:F-box domain [Arabidopsis suecica]|uniref:F-box domain n=1 Tax=Arabidopsis suecica TaxID=45249 RepID=A0A8T1ZVY9_ARASU|nr:F-box domain [Arabidopsis suecica]
MMRVSKTPRETGRRTLPEALLVEIIARLPLKSIARFKSVCKTLKSVIESTYFRSFFVSLHLNSLPSWSLMLVPEYWGHYIAETIGFAKCETWGLPKSLHSYIVPFQLYPNLSPGDYYYVCSSNGLILISLYSKHLEDNYKYFVGNPVLQQWVKIPPPPNPRSHPNPNPYGATGLVTRVENGAVSSFKMITDAGTDKLPRDKGMYVWRVCVYSSETGLWSFKQLLSPRPVETFYYYAPVNIDEMLYMWKKDCDPTEPKVLIAHDFYGSETECRVIPLPVPYNENVKRCLTTSRGDVICVEILHRKLKIWRLNINSLEDGYWQLLTPEINMAYVGLNFKCFPMAMNPFDSDIIYLWSRKHSCLVSGNLHTQEFIVHHQDSENWTSDESCCRINTYDFKYYMEHMERRRNRRNQTSIIMLSQFVLPRWMDSVPRPPN